MKLAILLATYNSSKYIEEQIDSLLSQSYRDFTLYIRDDGSKDNTLEIISSYCDNNSNVLFLDDVTKGRGAMGSFMWLLESVDAEYYMFCDHDDVWLPFKIEVTLNKMLELEATNGVKTPIAVDSDLEVVDEHLNTIAPSMYKYMGLKFDVLNSYKYLSVCNCFTGCTMMINHAAKIASLPLSINATMHDYWIALNVIAKGGILGHIDIATIRYRQHSNNAVGAKKFGYNYLIRSKEENLRILRYYKQNMAMLNDIKRVSTFNYFLYKLLYLIRRC